MFIFLNLTLNCVSQINRLYIYTLLLIAVLGKSTVSETKTELSIKPSHFLVSYRKSSCMAHTEDSTLFLLIVMCS